MNNVRYTLIIAWAVIMLVISTGCGQKQSSYLQSLVDEMRRECPVPNEVADGVVVTNISHDDNNLLMELTITDKVTKELFRNGDYFRLNSRYTLGESRFAHIKEAMKSNGFGIKCVAKDESGKNINEVTIAPSDLDKEEAIGVVVRATAMAENAACPLDYGNGSVLERAEALGDSTIVYYIEGGEAFANTDFAAVEDMMKRQMINSISDSESNKQVRHDVGISYKYVYKYGDKVCHSLTITPDDWLRY